MPIECLEDFVQRIRQGSIVAVIGAPRVDLLGEIDKQPRSSATSGSNRHLNVLDDNDWYLDLDNPFEHLDGSEA